MSYELFQLGPSVYVPILLISCVITTAAYGIIPISYALFRNLPIEKKAYRRHCYCANIVVMVLFMTLKEGQSNPGPYLLWTTIISSLGSKILDHRKILIDGKNSPQSTNTNQFSDTILFCRKCGDRLIDHSQFCRKCGTKIMK